MKTRVMVAVILSLALPIFAAASVYYASPNGTSGGLGTLESPYDAETAVAKAVSGDEVRLLDGTYTFTCKTYAEDRAAFQGALRPAGGVTIRGWIRNGDKPALGDLREQVVLDTQKTGRAIYMKNAAAAFVVRDLVFVNLVPAIQSGYPYHDGGVYLLGNADSLITNCAFRCCSDGGNTSGHGCGAYVSGNAVLADCDFSENDGDILGAAAAVHGDAKAVNCRFSDNHAVNGRSGGAVDLRDRGVISGCTFTDNDLKDGLSAGGGALRLEASGALVTNSTFVGGAFAGSYGAAGIFNSLVQGGTNRIVDCTFTDNGDGRVIRLWAANFAPTGALEIVHSTFAGNASPIFCERGAVLRIWDSTFEDNSFENGQGGAINFQSSVKDLLVSDCTFRRNHAKEGGAIAVTGPYGEGHVCHLAITGSTFEDNDAQSGGAIAMTYNSNTQSKMGAVIAYTNCTFRRNTARVGNGGAIYAWGGRYADCVFEDNLSTNFTGGSGNCRGGAIAVAEKKNIVDPEATNKASFVRCTFSRNVNAGTIGTCVYCEVSDYRFEDCTFRANRGKSGALYDGSCAGFFIDRCRFEANDSVDGAAAGLLIAAHGSVVRNSLFLFNTNCYYWAGALQVNAVGARIDNCTFVGNRNDVSNKYSGQGGAIYLGTQDDVQVNNCIFHDNSDGFYVARGYHRVSDIGPVPETFTCVSNCCTAHYFGSNLHLNPACGNYYVEDPLFKDAASGDYMLTKGSPCVDRGLTLPWMAGARDIRNKRKYARVYGIAPDLGCYEYQPEPGMMLLLR